MPINNQKQTSKSLQRSKSLQKNNNNAYINTKYNIEITQEILIITPGNPE